MRSLPKASLVLLVLLSVTACVSPRSYVDPQFAKASYSDIKPVASRYDVNLSTEFQRNGQPLPQVDAEIRNLVEQALRATAVVVPTTAPSGTKMHVVVNNIGNRGAAAAKGIGTGLTFGAIGSTVTDSYEIRIAFQSGAATVDETFSHAIHTTIGNASAPVDAPPTSTAEAVRKMIQDVILNFVKAMQDQGQLTRLRVFDLWEKPAQGPPA